MDSQGRSHPQNVEYSGDNAESNTDSSENSEYTWESTYVYEDSSGEYSGSSYTCYSSDSIFCSDELSEPTSDDVDATKVTSGSRERTAISGSSGTDAASGTQITYVTYYLSCAENETNTLVQNVIKTYTKTAIKRYYLAIYLEDWNDCGIGPFVSGYVIGLTGFHTSNMTDYRVKHILEAGGS